MTKSQKLKLLRIWKQDAILMQEAAAEDMAGGEDDRLQEVHKAIDKVGLSRD